MNSTNSCTESLEETLILAQLTEGKQLCAIRPNELTIDGVIAAMEHANDASLLLVKPPYLIIETESLDASLGSPIDDFSSLFRHNSYELDGDENDENGDGKSEQRGEGFEITESDWNNVLLLCNDMGDKIDAVDIDWLVEAGLAEKSSGGHPRPSPLALKWAKLSG